MDNTNSIRESIKPKLDSLRDEQGQKIKEILNEEQLKKYKELLM